MIWDIFKAVPYQIKVKPNLGCNWGDMSKAARNVGRNVP